MEIDIDFEVEIGGGAPVIEAFWSGFIDLRDHAERIAEIPEADSFPPLARLLRSINDSGSRFWTSKCDVWEPEASALAIYIDVLPLESTVFVRWQQAESICRQCADRLRPVSRPLSPDLSGSVGATRSAVTPEIAVNLVVRQAIAGKAEGFGVTAYLSARGGDPGEAAAALERTMAVFADALLSLEAPPIQIESYNRKNAGE